MTNALFTRIATSAAVSRRTILAAAGALLAKPVLGAGDSWPTRTIRLVVPFAAGGTTDALARLLGQMMSERLGQQVIIENRPGAGTNLGADAVAKAPPDGYTLLMGTPSVAVNPALFPSMPYHWELDLLPVAMVGYVPNLLVVHPSLPVASVAELIAHAKANPGKLEFGSSGLGGATHLSGELFKAMAGVDMLHVPYRGSAPAMNDLLGGRIALMFDNLPNALPQARDGKLRALAVTGSRRSPVAPEYPTVAEAGLPGFEVLSWNGVFLPSGTSPEIVARLRNEVRVAMASHEVKKRTDAQGIETAEVDDFRAFVTAEAAKWQPLVRRLGLKAE